MIKNSRENAFDFLRLLAAMAVVVGHSVTHLDTNFFWHDPGEKYWFYDGVALFFVLSGMLVYKSCENSFEKKRPLFQYYVNRLLRIAPALYVYLIVTTISFFIFGVLTTDDLNIGFFAWFASTVFLVPVYHPAVFNDFGVGVVNGSLWTIPVEFGFYVILPLFVLFKRKYGFSKMMVLLLILSIGSMMLYNYGKSGESETPLLVKFFGVSFLPHLIFFTVGIFLGKLWNRIAHSWVLAGASLILYIIIRYDLVFELSSTYLVFDLIWVLPFGYFVIWFGYNAPSIFYKFTNRLGDISYGVYIWHMVVVNYFIYFGFNDQIKGTVSVLLVIAVTTVLGLLSWWLVEKQALKFKPYNSKTGEERAVKTGSEMIGYETQPTKQ